MPKQVDHDERRRTVASKVMRLIATEGVEAVTTRRIAEETGYANGLLRYYFPSKDSAVLAALQYVFDATNARAKNHKQQPGLPAIRALATEVLPLDQQRMDEARVVVAFWERAINSASETEYGRQRLEEWKSDFRMHAEAARESGDLPTTLDVEAFLDDLMVFLMGAQVTALFAGTEPAVLIAQLDRILERAAHA